MCGSVITITSGYSGPFCSILFSSTSHCCIIWYSVIYVSVSYFFGIPIIFFLFYISCYGHPFIVCYQVCSYLLTLCYCLCLCQFCNWQSVCHTYRSFRSIVFSCIPICSSRHIWSSGFIIAHFILSYTKSGLSEVWISGYWDKSVWTICRISIVSSGYYYIF